MEAYEVLWISSILLGFIAIAPPGFHYLRAKRYKGAIAFPEGQPNPPPLTVILPVKDESKVIRDKLEEILGMDYPQSNLKILVIDSGSIDSTGDIARQYLIEKAEGVEWSVESIERPGKSIAVNSALGLIDTDFFVMMDADAILQSSALMLLVRWFQNPDIGGVCGGLALPSGTPGSSYRIRFNTIRVGESVMDSTPIFEGSICAFRLLALGSGKITPHINADDSQLAMLVRRNGYRAIMDPELFFTEKPQAINRQRKRGVRRSQGLVRALFANRDLISSKGKYGSIHALAFHFYILMPWLLLLSLISLLSSILLIASLTDNLGMDRFTASGAILLAGLLSGTFREFIRGASVLLESQLLLIFGVKLNVWETDRD